MVAAVAFEGRGLHTGAPARLVLRRADGPVTLGRPDATRTPIAALSIATTDRSTTVASRDGALRIATVEHLFAALAGLGIRSGVAIEIEGPEVPLVDGAALAFAEGLASLDVPASPPSLRIVAEGIVEVGPARYELAPASSVSLEVEVAFESIGLVARAAWDGTAARFVAEIAPARTFGLEHEVMELVARGLASHVSPESVLVLGRDRVLSSGRPVMPAEPARHKLLDLAGDLYLHGGPPRGRVRALRPGHAWTHQVVREALGRGLVAYAG